MAYRGIEGREEIRKSRRTRDVRNFRQKWRDFFADYSSSVLFLMLLFAAWVGLGLLFALPFAAETVLLFYFLFGRKHYRFDRMRFSFPYRVPKLAEVLDASYPREKLGEGITYWGNEKPRKEQIYAGDSDMRTHNLVLGTTGSGKTELLLGLVTNALVQNSGFIYVDGKGDPALMGNIFRLMRTFGREDDLLLINFITSGRDFFDKQADKVTNNMNLMGKASSGMIIELITGLLDDSGSSGDMWKGRCILFVATLTRPLCYLRDKGHLHLSAETYLQYLELGELEKLVYEPEKQFPNLDVEQFTKVLDPLRSYINNIPGYNQKYFAEKKQQEQKTLEQHGYITMQLGRVFNDLNYNYAHIFKADVGDIDFYDVVLNRRCLAVLLPALERAPDTLKMCGKLIVGNIKQMMAGCLGNRVEGQVREILDSRSTNSPTPYYVILDEYGYYAVLGFAVAPAQARSLGFSMTFAAQDFSSLKKSSAEEADATWENTNVRAIGRLTSGKESETWRRVAGASGEAFVAGMTGLDRSVGMIDDKFRTPDSIAISRVERLDYDDVAAQQDGEFTFIVGKKHDRENGGVRVMRGMGFYTASEKPREMRINDLVPVIMPRKDRVPSVSKLFPKLQDLFDNHGLPKSLTSKAFCPDNRTLIRMSQVYDYMSESGFDRQRQSLAAAWWLLERANKPMAIGTAELIGNMAEVDETQISRIHQYIDDLLENILNPDEIIATTGSPAAARSIRTVDGQTVLLASEDEEIDGSTTFAYVSGQETANAADPYPIASDVITEYYSVFREIELFRRPSIRVVDGIAVDMEETDGDSCTREQLRELNILIGEGTVHTDRPLAEEADRQYDHIRDTVRKQTDTANIRKPEVVDTDKIRLVMGELLDNLALYSNQQIEKIINNKK